MATVVAALVLVLVVALPLVLATVVAALVLAIISRVIRVIALRTPPRSQVRYVRRPLLKLSNWISTASGTACVRTRVLGPPGCPAREVVTKRPTYVREHGLART